MTTLLLIMNLALAVAEPGWFEAEVYESATGAVTLLDETATDYGRMARDEAADGRFIRIAPGAVLRSAPRALPAGTYAVWIRVFAIDGRLTEVRVDDRVVGTSRGGPNRANLVWQRIGTVALPAGEHRLTLAAAPGNTGLAYLDVAWLVAEEGLVPYGKTPEQILRAAAQVAQLVADFETEPLGEPLGEPWTHTPGDDQWTRVVAEDGRRCLRIHNGTGESLVIQPGLAVVPDASRQLRVSFVARRYGISESIRIDLPGIGTWQPMLRRDWTEYEQVFLVPSHAAGPVLSRLEMRSPGDILLDDLRIGSPTPPVDPFETGRFLPAPSLSREGRLFELERYVVDPALVTADDLDGDRRWSLVRLDRDQNTPMLSRGTALKSDTDPALSPALEFDLTDLLPGPYQVWACATSRPAEWQLGDGEAVAGKGLEQTDLGQVVVPASGQVRLRARQLPADPDNPGPAYLDYVTFIPTENAAFTSLPAPVWAETAADGVEREQVGFTLRRGGVATGGVALPAGALGNPEHCRVLSGGRPVATSARALCRWPDGSIKWLLVTAGPLPAGEATLEYGRAVRPAAAPPLPAVQVARGEGQFWQSLEVGGLTLGPLAGELVLADGTSLRPAAVTVTETGDGVVTRQLKLTGTYAAGARRPFGFELLVTWGRDSADFLVEHTFITVGPAAQEQIKSLRLTCGVAGGAVSCPELAGATATRLRLKQDGANPWGEPIVANYELRADDRTLAGERASGRASSGEWQLAVDDFVEQFPMAVAAEADALTVEIWPEDAAEGPFVANRGMAKTHSFRIARGELALPVVDWLRFDPAALRASGALGKLTPVGPASADYDALLEPAFQDVLTGRGGFGMEHWGDVFQGGYVRGVKTWSNQEWDLVWSWLTVYARTGDPRYLDYADAAARHFADVDCIHAGPEQIVGGARTHCHTSLIGHQLEGPNLAHSGWVEGLLNHYYLTGCERSRRAAVAIGEWTARECAGRDQWTSSGPPFRLPQNRQAGWPLVTLCLVYQETRDPELLVAARRIVDYMRRCQMPARGCWEAMTPHEYPWRGGCVFAFTNFRGLKLYAEITGEEAAEEDRRQAGIWLLGELWRPNDRYLYEQCPTHEPGTNVGFLQWGSLADLTDLTDNPLYLLVALDGLGLRLQNPKQLVNDMARAQWGHGTIQQGSNLLAIAAERLPSRPAGVVLEPVAPEVSLTAGGEVTVSFRLRNETAEPLTELQGWPLVRGDWKLSMAAPPARVAPGESVTLTCQVTAPPAVALVEQDNDRAYCHLAVSFTQPSGASAVRAVCRLTAGR